MTLTQLVQRLLDKRCVTFMNSQDSYLLISGEKGQGGFTTIGKPWEKKRLILKNCLSYDEMKLSAFLSVSSFTEFLNDGNRYNNGIYECERAKIQSQGVVVGVIGARFEKPFYMEYQDIVISPQQNTTANSYGSHEKEGNDVTLDPDQKRNLEKRKLWQAFYEEPDFLYDQVVKDNQRFGNCYPEQSKEIFDNVRMSKRYALTFDTLLMEAQSRARKENTQAYIHIVGIGLGVWKKASQQREIFLETFAQRVRHLLPHLNNIGVLHFSWFHVTEWLDLKHNEVIASPTHPLGDIRVLMANRNPAEKLSGEFEKMLLVISYAWDGNALPGNEFWVGSLSGTNDPSTAASTLIAELHNPHINTQWVCGENLYVAAGTQGLMHIRDYVGKISKQL